MLPKILIPLKKVEDKSCWELNFILSCIQEIKSAQISQNDCKYLVHNYNNLYNNIRRADKLTSMTSFVGGCILIEPACLFYTPWSYSSSDVSLQVAFHLYPEWAHLVFLYTLCITFHPYITHKCLYFFVPVHYNVSNIPIFQAPLLHFDGEIAMCAQWLFCREFNSKQFLLVTFFHIICIFGSIQP